MSWLNRLMHCLKTSVCSLTSPWPFAMTYPALVEELLIGIAQLLSNSYLRVGSLSMLASVLKVGEHHARAAQAIQAAGAASRSHLMG